MAFSLCVAGPQHIEQEARSIASIHGASCETIVGDELLEKNYPAIHTVGRAAENAPRLIDIRWSPSGRSGLPRITLVGKGVAFDTEGNLYVAASLKGRRGIIKIDRKGEAQIVIAGSNIIGLAFGYGKAVYVASSSSIYRINL